MKNQSTHNSPADAAEPSKIGKLWKNKKAAAALLTLCGAIILGACLSVFFLLPLHRRPAERPGGDDHGTSETSASLPSKNAAHTAMEEKISALIEAEMQEGTPDGASPDASSPDAASSDAASSDASTAPGAAVADKIIADMTFRVTDVKAESCTVSVSAPDVNALFFEVFHPEEYGEAESMEEYAAIVEKITAGLADRLAAQDCPVLTTTVELPLDETGAPVFTYEMVDAMYGGCSPFGTRFSSSTPPPRQVAEQGNSPAKSFV